MSTLDDFERADGSPGSNWTELHSTPCAIVSGALKSSTIFTETGVKYTGTPFTSNQSSKVILSEVGPSGSYWSVGVRYSGGVGTFNGYRFSGSGTDWYLTKVTNGTGTGVDSGSSTFQAGDVLEITAVGSVIRGYKNGVQITTTTDASYTDGAPGVEFYNLGVGYASWEGTDLTVTSDLTATYTVIGAAQRDFTASYSVFPEPFTALGSGADLTTRSDWAQHGPYSLVGDGTGRVHGGSGGGGSQDIVHEYTGGSFSNSQWAELTVSASGSSYLGPAVRVTPAGDCWGMSCINTNGYINRYAAGVYSGETFSIPGGGPPLGTVVRLSIEDLGGGNSRLRAYYDGVLQITQDVSNGPASGNPGITGYSGPGNYGDNFDAGDLSTATSIQQDLFVTYTVVSAVQQDLAATYGIIVGSQSDLAASYTVVSGVEKDLAGAYEVVSGVTKDLVATYPIQNVVQADVAASYAVVNSAQLDFAASYGLSSAITADSSYAYGLAGTVVSDLAGAFDILSANAVTKDLSAAFSIENSLTSDLAAAYGVQAAAQLDLSASYSTLNGVSRDLDAAYVVRSEVVSNLVGSFDILGAAHLDLEGVWTVTAGVQADLTALWVDVGSVSNDLVGSSSIVGSASSDLTASYIIFDESTGYPSTAIRGDPNSGIIIDLVSCAILADGTMVLAM